MAKAKEKLGKQQQQTKAEPTKVVVAATAARATRATRAAAAEVDAAQHNPYLSFASSTSLHQSRSLAHSSIGVRLCGSAAPPTEDVAEAEAVAAACAADAESSAWSPTKLNC